MFQKILFPADGSMQSKIALDHVISLAQKFNSKVEVLTVYELPSEVTGMVGTYTTTYSYLEVLEKNVHEYSEKIAKEVADALEEAGIDHSTSILKGPVASTIVEHAERVEAEAIIIGSRGFGAVKSMLLGSVSSYVMHHSKVPVLVVH